MLKLLAFLWSGCWHKWKKIASGPLETDYGSRGQRYITECEKCGAIRKWDCV